MGHQDNVFFKTFFSILAVLVVLAFGFFGIAQTIATGDKKVVAKAVSDTNIAREGEVRVASKVMPKADSKAAKNPEEMGAMCIACHKTGVGGAPKMGSKDDWTTRAKAGVDSMVGVVVKGKGIMQPRGGTQLTDAEIKTVVVYMLEKSDIKSK